MLIGRLNIMTNKKEVVEEKVTKANKNEATVKFRGTERTYTKELHGDDFAKLAKEFSDKKGGEIV